MPVCSHCSNNVEFELYECQEICPQCGTVASSECLTNNVQFQAPSYPLQSTGYLDPSVKALYSIYPTTDSYTSNRRHTVKYLQQCAQVLQMEAQLEILLDSFSMVIPENSETLEGPKIRWGTHAEATAIACCILTARKYGKYISIGETSVVYKFFLFFYRTIKTYNLI
ncbi:hypothetical protein HMI55_000413 [Coelomomyces lativittatus]|nr:hypothetical protein HMI55_000413 [Coelomomyces lativittatus]